MSFCAASNKDPFTPILISVSQPANIDLTGKTPTNLKGLNPATTGVFVHAGQSIGANSVIPTLYTPTNITKIFNVNAYDGSVTQGKDPLIGTSNPFGNYQTQLADLMVNNAMFDNVILCPIAISGSALHNWLPFDNLYWQYPTAAAQRLRWLGFEVTAFLWDQGTSDVGTPQATYLAGLNEMIGIVRSNGFPAPWVIAKSTMQFDFNIVPTVRAACDQIVNPANDIIAGPDLDSLTGLTYRDGTSLPHFNAAGATAAANLWFSSLGVLV